MMPPWGQTLGVARWAGRGAVRDGARCGTAAGAETHALRRRVPHNSRATLFRQPFSTLHHRDISSATSAYYQPLSANYQRE